MPTVINDPQNKPPPPSPDVGDGPDVPTGIKKVARVQSDCNMASRASGVGRQGFQRPDHRRTLYGGPASHHAYGPSTNSSPDTQPYPGGTHHLGSNQPGGNYYPRGGPPPGYGPPRYPVVGGAPSTRQSPVSPGPSPFTSGGYKPPGTLVKNWRKFVMNQKVHVNVVGNGWLVGFVITVLEALGMVTNSPVRVRYMDHDRQREDVFENHPDYIRPYPDSEY